MAHCGNKNIHTFSCAHMERHTHSTYRDVETSNINRIFNTLNPMIRYFIWIYSSCCRCVCLTFSLAHSIFVVFFLHFKMLSSYLFYTLLPTFFRFILHTSRAAPTITMSEEEKNSIAKNNHQKRVRDLNLFRSFFFVIVFFSHFISTHQVCASFSMATKSIDFCCCCCYSCVSLCLTLLAFRFFLFQKFAHGFRFRIAHLMFGWLIIRYKYESASKYIFNINIFLPWMDH